MNILDVGGEYGIQARLKFPNDHITTLDLVSGWDVMEKGLPAGNWDMIYSSHFIEHIVDPDFFLSECKRVSNERTVLHIETPNLAAWFNRLILLLGFIPHFYECSKLHNVGKIYNGSKEKLAGHIRLFTPKALCDLITLHGFKILSVKGNPTGYSPELFSNKNYPFFFLFNFLDKLFNNAFFTVEAVNVS